MPHCAYCGKRADQIDEYIYAANGSQLTVLQYVIEEEGTLNPRTNHFACTDCYIKIGMPANRYPEPNWTVPDDVEIASVVVAETFERLIREDN